MSDDTLELTCPTCRHIWRVSLADLERVDQIGALGPPPARRKEQYRVRCPKCNTYWIITVTIEEDGDG